MKYENEGYERCFDFLFEDKQYEALPTSLIVILEEEYDTEITNKEEFEDELTKLFERFHEKGIIRPLNKNKKEK